MNDLMIIGASGFGREVAWIVERINKVSPTWNLIGFLDDNEDVQNTTINGYAVLGIVEDVIKYPDVYYICAIGASRVRENVVNRALGVNPNIRFATLIDPSVEISNLVDIGEGTVICAHSIITVNISIGTHVIINLDCTVGHDAVIKDFATLYPSVNISGISTIGYCTELGTGMQIIQAKSIGDYTIVGAGAVVVKDIPSKCTAVGNPAKPIRFFE